VKLWRFADPHDAEWAEAGRRGTWSSSSGPCPQCGATQQRRVRPLLLAWEPGSNRVGDFSWPGFDDDVVVTKRVFDELASRFRGFEAGGVQIVDDPARTSSRGTTRVRVPYDGPDLRELWTTPWVHVDKGRSSIELEHECSSCGTRNWEVYGVERLDSSWNAGTGVLEVTRTERLPGAGIFIDESELKGADIFRVAEFPGWVLLTDPVRSLILSEAYTNVAFLQVSDTLAPDPA
jgi:hypothetical protein